MSTAGGTVGHDVRVIAWVGVAHGLSHFFQLLLPPLFPLVKESFGLSYAALGTLVSVFYVVSGLMQTPAGFAVDRFGPHRVLVFGLAAATLGAVLTAIAPSYAVLVLAAVIAGAGNSVFHPADMALLNAKVSNERLGHAFSLHNVGGNLGYVSAPVFAIAIGELFGWRVALAAGACVGLVFGLLFAAQRILATEPLRKVHAGGEPAAAAAVSLASRPMVMGFLFFLLQSVAMVGFMTFSPTAFGKLYGAPTVLAASLLTAFLVGGIAGTLTGGFVAGRAAHHDRVAMGGVLASGVLAAAIATGALPLALLWPAAFGVGFMMGIANPSRDILIRGIAPAHARGRVYGFVYSGLDAGGAIAPIVFGWLLDHGHAWATFAAASICMVLALPVVALLGRDAAPGRKSPRG